MIKIRTLSWLGFLKTVKALKRSSMAKPQSKITKTAKLWCFQTCKSSNLPQAKERVMQQTRASCQLMWKASNLLATRINSVSSLRNITERYRTQLETVARWTWRATTDRVLYQQIIWNLVSSSISSSLPVWVSKRSRARLRATCKYLRQIIQTRLEKSKSR